MRHPKTLVDAIVLASALNFASVSSSAIPEHEASGLPSQRRSVASTSHIDASYWYDWGWHGTFPRSSYESFGADSPKPNLLQTDERCYDGFTFIEPRGQYVETPGPIILDNTGSLVWMQTLWGQAMDVKVQQYKAKDYITFWHGTDNGTFGEGYYLMLDEHYEVFKTIQPVGDGLTGDLHEFRITDQDTALMTIYSKAPADMSAYGISDGWIFDSIFQEVDIETGKLLFEWHASDAFAAHDSLAPLEGHGTSESAFDFFHINSIDTDLDGNFIISSRYFCSITCISRKDGSVLWELGGANNGFKDLSDGRATDFAWNHHASWYDKENHVLTIFDNAAWGFWKSQTNADYSRGLMIQLDLDNMTATLLHSYVSPQKLLSSSQGSVQVLPNKNVLVGWGHTPAWTEFTMEGEVLCDTHIAPIWLANFGWAKNYRTFKYPWVGHPKQPPDVAMRPDQSAIFVSWNGATEVRSWQLQMCTDKDGSFEDIGGSVAKAAFETRLGVPSSDQEYVRVVALGADGNVLGHSNVVSRYEETVTPLLEAPERIKLPSPTFIFAISLSATLTLIFLAYIFRLTIRRWASMLLHKTMSKYKYQRLATGD